MKIEIGSFAACRWLKQLFFPISRSRVPISAGDPLSHLQQIPSDIYPRWQTPSAADVGPHLGQMGAPPLPNPLKHRKPIQHFAEPASFFLSHQNGGYLLLRSTIGVTGLNFSVRNGKRWIPRAITTLMSFFLFNPRPSHDLKQASLAAPTSNPSRKEKVSGY